MKKSVKIITSTITMGVLLFSAVFGPCEQAKAADIYVDKSTFFLRGNSVTIEAADNGLTAIYLDADKNGVKDSDTPLVAATDLSSGYIVGADTLSGVSPSYSITVNGGNIGSLYGENAVSECGTVTISINGGTIGSLNVVNQGNPNPANTDNDITLNLNGGTITNCNLVSSGSTGFSVYVNNIKGQVLSKTDGCAFMNDTATGVAVCGNYFMKRNMSISKGLTISSGSVFNIPSGKSFSTSAAIQNSGIIKCEGSFKKTDSDKNIGEAWFIDTPDLAGGVDQYVAVAGNALCFPLTMKNSADANAVSQLIAVTATPESVAAGGWAKLTKPSFYVKAGSTVVANVVKNDFSYSNNSIKQFYIETSDGTKVELKKGTTGFSGVMPNKPGNIFVSTKEGTTEEKKDETTEENTTVEEKTKDDKSEEKTEEETTTASEDVKKAEDVKEPITTKDEGTVIEADSGKAEYRITTSDDGSKTPVLEFESSKEADVKVPESVTIAGKKVKVVAIKAGAFKNNKKLKKITIAAGIKKIGNSAFSGCTALKTVSFKKGSKLETIGKNAFSGCKALTSMTITSTKLKSIGKQAFKKAGSKNYKKLVIKVPKAKITKYKKLLKSAGLSKKAKIKK